MTEEKTLIETDSIVVHRVALNDHPLVVGEDDERSDEELIEDVAERTEVADDLDFPGWTVMVSDPPDGETIRYVNTATRLNVKAVYRDTSIGNPPKYDFIEELEDRIDIEGFDMENAAMSAFPAEHEDDFEYDVNLDLTGDNDD